MSEEEINKIAQAVVQANVQAVKELFALAQKPVPAEAPALQWLVPYTQNISLLIIGGALSDVLNRIYNYIPLVQAKLPLRDNKTGSHAGTCLGILASDGVLVAAENRNVHKLLDEDVLAEKIYRISDNIVCSAVGNNDVANILINRLRRLNDIHKFDHGKSMLCKELDKSLCNEKQQYTQVGGKRPFGVSLLYMGYDQQYGFQLYQSDDPSGAYTDKKFICIGNNHQTAVSLFEQEYKSPNLVEAKKLAMKVLSKTLDVKLSSDKVEMAILTRRDNKTVIEELTTGEIGRLIKEHEEREREAEAAAATGTATS